MQHTDDPAPVRDTASDAYADRLALVQSAWWKKLLPVQAPYRWNLRRQRLGRTLEIGCGIGRNLQALPKGSVGVDHNSKAVAIARERGFTSLDLAEWDVSPLRQPESFDGILISHVLEHMDDQAARTLLHDYLLYLRPAGRVFMICPQERGYASDPTHVRFLDGAALVQLAQDVGLLPGQPFSFPFPRWAGPLFIYNEFCLLSRKQA